MDRYFVRWRICPSGASGMLFQRIYNLRMHISSEDIWGIRRWRRCISGTAMYMMTSVMMGVTTGVSIVISQFYGAGENRKIRETFSAGIHVSIWMTVLITAAGAATTEPLLRLLQTSRELMPDASAYLFIIYAGCGATMLYNFASAVLRALGNSVVPLVFFDPVQRTERVPGCGVCILDSHGGTGGCLCYCVFSAPVRALCLAYAGRSCRF